MEEGPAPGAGDDVARYADMFAAIGAEPRLRILRLLLSAHPVGMIVGDIQAQLAIPSSTLSHHLEKLKNEGLVEVRRDRRFLWYRANGPALKDLLAFLYAECCSRTAAVPPESILVPLRQARVQQKTEKTRPRRREPAPAWPQR